MTESDHNYQTYASGFQAGESAAFLDRRNRIVRAMPQEQTWWARGYIDGYTPRSTEWALRSPDAAPAWWVDREAA